MRKYLASLAFTGCLAIAAPLAAATATETAEPEATVAMQRMPAPVSGLRDEAAMVLLGTALIGVAAAVRRRAV
jgi:hypothetical protein